MTDDFQCFSGKKRIHNRYPMGFYLKVILSINERGVPDGGNEGVTRRYQLWHTEAFGCRDANVDKVFNPRWVF